MLHVADQPNCSSHWPIYQLSSSMHSTYQPVAIWIDFSPSAHRLASTWLFWVHLELACSLSCLIPCTRWLFWASLRIGSCTVWDYLPTIASQQRLCHSWLAGQTSILCWAVPRYWWSCCLCTTRSSVGHPKSKYSQLHLLWFWLESETRSLFQCHFCALWTRQFISEE